MNVELTVETDADNWATTDAENKWEKAGREGDYGQSENQPACRKVAVAWRDYSFAVPVRSS